MSTDSPLVISHLTKYYGRFIAVQDASFEIFPGEIFGLLGPNGAGKTTIISTIMTLQKLTKGSIHVFGIDLKTNPRLAKMQIGFVPQELIHHPFFTVEEILHYHINFFGLPNNPAYTHYLLDQLHLYPHRHKHMKQLSGGMKRRLLIVKALLHKPKLLLLDEPTAGIDLELRVSLWHFIKQLKQDNISILLTTHYLEEAERLCDRIAILQNGIIKCIGSVDRLLQEYANKNLILKLKSPLPPLHHPYLKSQTPHALHCNMPRDFPFAQLLEEMHIDPILIFDIEMNRETLADVMNNFLGHSYE